MAATTHLVHCYPFYDVSFALVGSRRAPHFGSRSAESGVGQRTDPLIATAHPDRIVQASSVRGSCFGLLATEVEERLVCLRAQEADARPTQAIVIGDAIMDALATPRFPGINIEHAVTTAIHAAAGAGFTKTLAIDEKATLAVVHDEFRITLALPVDARPLMATSSAIRERAATLLRDAFLAALLLALGTALPFSFLPALGVH
jgi:hypothetical protein